jgi:DNA-directed RNA polymerase I subunit RPA1
VTIPAENETARKSLASTLLTGASKGKQTKVFRHLKDGDIVLFNRQPSLHKPSIMGHYVKVLKEEKTFRLHYANCATYNADFDGDEMNLHFPQSEFGRAEAMEILNADQQYITGRNGGPLRGLIQDAVVSGVMLTKRDTFFDRTEFQQLVYSSCSDVVKHTITDLPPPAIIKAQSRGKPSVGPLWTGKQVITAILNQLTRGKPKLNLDSKAKVPDDMWGKNSQEGTVLVSENDLLVGVLDKNQFGATSYGLVHAVYELYGAKTAGLLLSALSRLFVLYLQVSIRFTA